MPAIKESFIGVFSPIICANKRSLNYQRQQLLFVIANRNNYFANFQIMGLQFVGRAGFVVGGTETTDRGVNFEWWRDTFHETSPRSCHDPVRGCLWAEGKLAQRVKKKTDILWCCFGGKKIGMGDWLVMVTKPEIMETYDCDVVVIGAGLSGLSCALYLTEKDRGLKLMVLEAKGDRTSSWLLVFLINTFGCKISYQFFFSCVIPDWGVFLSPLWIVHESFWEHLYILS